MASLSLFLSLSLSLFLFLLLYPLSSLLHCVYWFSLALFISEYVLILLVYIVLFCDANFLCLRSTVGGFQLHFGLGFISPQKSCFAFSMEQENETRKLF